MYFNAIHENKIHAKISRITVPLDIESPYLIITKSAQNFRVVSCAVELHDSCVPYFLTGHIIRTLLTNCGYTLEVEQEQLLKEMLSEDFVPYLYLLNDVIGFEVILAFPNSYHHDKLGAVARKPVLGVSDKASVKPVSSATETTWKIKISLEESLHMVLCKSE